MTPPNGATKIVIQMRKALLDPPAQGAVDGIVLRCFRDETDIGPWLRLREQAFAKERVGVRNWDLDDFRREYLDRSWWRPEHLWLAELAQADQRSLVGSVTLARRGDVASGQPVVHWLAVAPRFRRLGIGRALMAQVEAAVWTSGEREILLETHVHWQKAVAFYESLGYVAAGEP